MDSESYWSGYLLGLIAGEGCFHINIFNQRNNQWETKRKNKIGFEIRPEFRLSLVSEDIESLNFVKKKLGFGDIYALKGNKSETSQIYVTGLRRCQEIVNFVDEHYLIGKKKKDYLLWKEIINLIKNKKHLSKEGILEIARIRDKMNVVSKNKKSARYRDYTWFKKNVLDDIEE